MEKLSDYEKGLQSANSMPIFHLGQEVVTPNGKGIIVKMHMPYNGLYITPESSTAVVWFSTMNSVQWVVKEYDLSDLTIE